MRTNARKLLCFLLCAIFLPLYAHAEAVSLQMGDQGPSVKQLQQRLQYFGLFSGQADGVYGQQTASWVGEAQRLLTELGGYSFPEIGRADELTLSLIHSEDETVEAILFTLCPGSRGERVKALQNRLIDLGMLSGYADGAYGSATQAAVMEFQVYATELELTTLPVTGNADPYTLELINSDLSVYGFKAPVYFDESRPLSLSPEHLYCKSCILIDGPTGEILLNMKSRVGLETVEIDPGKKYFKPAGYGNPPAAHYEYTEKGRRPWKYRPAGSAIARPDGFMPYPRTCAHRGFNTIAPENSLPAFGAAVAMGAEEIEFDLWFTKDGEVVSIHDPVLDRVSNGTGNVWDHTLAQLKALDFGSKYGEAFAGLQIPTFEEILKKFSCHCVMNIHLKTGGDKPEYLDKVIALIKKYDCEKYVYLMCAEDAVLERLQKEYPHIPRCAGSRVGWDVLDRAIRYDCQKVQFFKPNFNQEMVDKAHAHGMICNVYWADDPRRRKLSWIWASTPF